MKTYIPIQEINYKIFFEEDEYENILKNYYIILFLVSILPSCRKGGKIKNSNKVPDSASTLQFQRNVALNGQNFFPIGFYGVNFKDTYIYKISCLNIISAAGFNTVVFEDISTSNFGGLLDRAE